MSKITQEELDIRFTYHAPRPDQIDKFVGIREAAKDLANVVASLTPPSREQALALTAIETTVFWANAAIARREKDVS